MIEFGISTASFYPLETEKALELIGKNGVKNAEIFFNASCELENSFVYDLKKIADYYGVNIISVHPTMSLAESFMLFSAYDRRKEEGLEQYMRYGEIAAIFGARYVIMHGGKPNGVLDDLQYCERYLEIGKAVKKSDCVLLQENVANYRAGKLEFLKMMVDNLGEQAAFCLDIKQCVRNGYTPFDAFTAIGSNVKHMHISDHTADKDCLLPGSGNFDYKKFFQTSLELGFSGYALTEVYRNAYTDFDELFSSQNIFQKKLA